jgi:hypothetical protein
VQFPVGESLVGSRFIALPEDRRLVGTGFQMPVQTIGGDIGFSTLEPFDGDWPIFYIVIIVSNLIPLYSFVY